MSDQVKVALIGASAIIAVGVVQAVDGPDPLVCSEVRSTVLSQAEQDPQAAAVPYPDDSREEKDCQINEYIVELPGND